MGTSPCPAVEGDGYGRNRLEKRDQGLLWDEESAKKCRVRGNKYQSRRDKWKIIRIKMELKLGRRIEEIGKLEFVAEDYYQTNIMDYLHIYSEHGVCQRSVQWTLLFTAFLVKGRLWPFTLFCFAGLSSYPSYP